MLTRLRVRNFKRFAELDVELGDPVVFVGPNNSGKTTAMQALALWDCGLRLWSARYADREAPAKSPGVAVGRRDLVSVPVSTARLLWHNQSVRDVTRESGKQRTSNIRIDVVVDGVAADGSGWRCGLEFDYANPESVYCRPMRLPGSDSGRMPVPEAALETPTAFLGPLSGLAANEARLDPGAIDVRIGEGRTAEVLRNLCHTLWETDRGKWNRVVADLEVLFGVTLQPPRYRRGARSRCPTPSADERSTSRPPGGDSTRRSCCSRTSGRNRAPSCFSTNPTPILRSCASGMPTVSLPGRPGRPAGRSSWPPIPKCC